MKWLQALFMAFVLSTGTLAAATLPSFLEDFRPLLMCMYAFDRNGSLRAYYVAKDALDYAAHKENFRHFIEVHNQAYPIDPWIIVDGGLFQQV